MKINTSEFHEVIKIAKQFCDLSKFFANIQKEYIKLYSNGDGKLYMVINNLHLKCIFKMPCEKDKEINQIFVINELFNIISNILNYEEFTIDENYLYFPDGHFSLLRIDDNANDDNFSVEMVKDFNNETNISDEVYEEIKQIFRIVTMKDRSKNTYFYRDNNLIFNFNNIYLKKNNSLLNFIKTDMFSLRIISMVLIKNGGYNMKYNIDDDDFQFSSDNFYIEGRVLNEEENNIRYIQNIFNCVDRRKETEKVNIKLEFYNWLQAVFNIDEDSSISFDGKSISMNSNVTQFVANFKIEKEIENEEFVIMVDTILKIVAFNIKNDSPDEIIFEIVDVSDIGRFLLFEIENIKILSEIA